MPHPNSDTDNKGQPNDIVASLFGFGSNQCIEHYYYITWIDFACHHGIDRYSIGIKYIANRSSSLNYFIDLSRCYPESTLHFKWLVDVRWCVNREHLPLSFLWKYKRFGRCRILFLEIARAIPNWKRLPSTASIAVPAGTGESAHQRKNPILPK